MDVDEIIRQIRTLDPTEPNFYGPQEDAVIDAVERLLEVRLPPSYRRFLKKYGGGDGYTGIYGSTPGGMDLGCIYGDNLRARESLHLPKHYLLFEISPFDELYCIELGDLDSEEPVVRFGTDRDGHLTTPIKVADSFTAYFEIDMRSRLEVLVSELGGNEPG